MRPLSITPANDCIVRERSPGIGIIVTSGKLRSAPLDLPPGAQFLRKPYWAKALAQAVDDFVLPRR